MPAPTIESHNHSTPSGGTTATIAVSASGAGRVIVVCATVETLSSPPVLSISGGGSNVGPWTALGSKNIPTFSPVIEAWYTVTTGAVSAATVTVTSSVTIDDAALAYVTIAGANTTQPADANSTLASGGSPGSASWTSTSNRQKALTISTNTANVLTFAQFGGQFSESYGSPLANSTLTESALNGGGANFANIGVFTAPFTVAQSGTLIGSSATSTSALAAMAFGITADSQGAAPRARQTAVMVG